MSSANQTFRFRESRRLLHEAAVRLVAPAEGGELSGWTRDVATGGMFVSTPTPMPVGTVARFLLQLGPDDESAVVKGEATVVWVRAEAGADDQPAGMGMQFSRVEPPGEERLAWLFSERRGDGDVIPSAPSRAAVQVEAPQPESPQPASRQAGAEADTVETGAHGEGPDAIEQPFPAPDARPAPAEIVQTESTALPAAPRPEPPAPDPPGPPAPAEIVQTESTALPAAPKLETPAPPEPEPPGDDRPSDDWPPAAEDADSGSDVGPTHVKLFGELAEDGDADYWMKPESKSRPWLWPAVGGAVLLIALFAFRGPLANLFGSGDAPTEEGEPVGAPGFEVSTPPTGAQILSEGADVSREGTDVSTESAEEAGESSPASRPSAPRETPAAAAEAPGGAEATEPVAAAEPPEADEPVAASDPGGAASTEVADAAAAERPLQAAPTPTVETGPPAEPAGVSPPTGRQPATAAPAPPVNATALRSITASTTGDRTVIEIVGNAPFRRHHVMLLEAPPRLLVRLIGVQRDFDARAVRGPRLRGVRTGVHGRGATRNLHVVLDLTASDVVAAVERRGDRVVVTLSD